jgi:outer membrane protein TolC
VVLGVLALGLVMTGCTPKAYKKQADNEVYSIIEKVEGGIFGVTNEFDINTKWSNLDPDTIFATEIIKERTETNTLILNLDLALDLATTQSRRYQTQKEQLYLTALSLTGEQYQFGPQFFANTSGDYTKTVTGERIGSLNSGVGVSQFFKTGGSLSVNLFNDILHYYTGNPRNSTINSMSVSFFQPLLRGFGKNNPAVERLTQAERNVIYAVRSYSYFQNEFAIEVVNDYFDLLGVKNVIRNNYANYVSQQDSTKRLEARSVDREAIGDVDQARQSELNAKNNYINSIAAYFNALDSFKIKLAIPLDVRVFIDDGELDELDRIGLIPVEIDKEAAFKLATEKNFNILNSIDEFEDSKRKIGVAANQLKADLNILGNASLASDAPTDYTSFDIDNVRYNVGVELDLPIDRLRERNNYRSTLINFEAAIRTLANDLDVLKDLIERGTRTLEQRRQNYIIDRSSVRVAERRVESATLKIAAGRATVRDLVEAQNALIESQNSVVSSLVSYQAARLDLLLNLGIVQTDTVNFWFDSQLDKAPEIIATNYKQLDLSGDAVIPPDELFRN